MTVWLNPLAPLKPVRRTLASALSMRSVTVSLWAIPR
jgi:hypothetical protein